MQLCKRKEMHGNKIRRKYTNMLTTSGIRWYEHKLNFLEAASSKGTINHLPWLLPGVMKAVRRGQVCGNQSSGVCGSTGRPGHHDPHFTVPGVHPITDADAWG